MSPVPMLACSFHRADRSHFPEDVSDVVEPDEGPPFLTNALGVALDEVRWEMSAEGVFDDYDGDVSIPSAREGGVV